MQLSFVMWSSLKCVVSGAIGIGFFVSIVINAACNAVTADMNSDDEKSRSSSGDGGASNNSANETAIPCEVDQIMAKRCRLCHGSPSNYGAPSSFTTLDEMRNAADRIRARIHDANRPMPPVSNAPMPADEIAIIDNWISSGAKGADPNSCDGANGTGPGLPALSCKPNMELKAKTPFVMQPGAKLDQYQCFGVDIDNAKKKHIVGIGPKIDNKNILHHILVFESREAIDPNPHDCNQFQSNWKMITGWAPGSHPFELPPEAGFPQNEGVTHYAIQLHYNNAKNLPGQQDNSGMQFCTTEELRPNDAAMIAFGSLKIDLPPRATTSIKCDYTLDERFKGVTIFSASPHMHKRGQSLSTHRLINGKTPEVDVFTQPTFDFENQGGHPISVKVAPGDVMRTECVFKNADDVSVKFGESTTDEMCFNFMSYYPAVPDEKGLLGEPIGKRVPGGGFSWVTPAIEDCGFSIKELLNLKNL